MDHLGAFRVLCDIFSNLPWNLRFYWDLCISHYRMEREMATFNYFWFGMRKAKVVQVNVTCKLFHSLYHLSTEIWRHNAAFSFLHVTLIVFQHFFCSSALFQFLATKQNKVWGHTANMLTLFPISRERCLWKTHTFTILSGNWWNDIFQAHKVLCNLSLIQSLAVLAITQCICLWVIFQTISAVRHYLK